jgi:hypothetical protein
VNWGFFTGTNQSSIFAPPLDFDRESGTFLNPIFHVSYVVFLRLPALLYAAVHAPGGETKQSEAKRPKKAKKITAVRLHKKEY